MSAKTASWLTAISMFGVYFAAACLVLPFDEVLRKATVLSMLAMIVAVSVLGIAALVLGALEGSLHLALLALSRKPSSDAEPAGSSS